MQASDEALRNTITDALTRANVDARNLTVEVAGGHVVAKGTVPTEQERTRVDGVLEQCRSRAGSVTCDVGVLEQSRRDSADGRGRSPVTGTSDDSQHESRHQRDRD